MNQDFMCPVCKSAPLITDYCPSCSRIEGYMAPPDAFPQAHRLALELECLLLSCADTAATAKWWDSAHEALEQWRQFCAVEPAPQQQPGHYKDQLIDELDNRATPLPDEVAQMVEALRRHEWVPVIQQAADMIERLSAERDSYKAMLKEQWAAGVPPDCVVMPREPSEAILDVLHGVTRFGLRKTYSNLIAAGEVKP